jgi:hypothetical protein
VLGGWFLTTLFTAVWLEGEMFVTHLAVCRRVTVERYHRVDAQEERYEWRIDHTVERFDFGSTPPELVEGRDYRLGIGAGAWRDRASSEDYHFVGGRFLTEKTGEWKPFRWVRLADAELRFRAGEVYRVQSDFYGHPNGNAGAVRPRTPLPAAEASPRLPSREDLPPAGRQGKVLGLGFGFFRELCVQEEYRGLLHGLLGGVAVLLALAWLSSTLRAPVLVFMACSTVVVPVVFLLVAARMGAARRVLQSLVGGGGGFGGRSISA